MSARQIAIKTLARQFSPDDTLRIEDPPTQGLSDPDARLTVAIVRTVQQRWMTLEHLLNAHLKPPRTMKGLEPLLRASLLCGAGQLLFMDRLPAYAVVNEHVELAGRMIRQGAGGMVNAVLRKIAALVADRSDRPWSPGADRLPLAPGTLRLSAPLLPDPARLPEHLAVATSHPILLVRRWLERFGKARCADLLEHSLLTPPTLVWAPDAQPDPPRCVPHAAPCFWLLEGSREDIRRFLAASPRRRVQDPSAQRALSLLEGLKPARVLDYCAGQGTKTRQLAERFPGSETWCWDIQQDRQKTLRELAGELPGVRVFDPAAEKQTGRFDLLVLDVPCSNSGVLSRRPEARYRFTTKSLNELTELQQAIAHQALPFLRPGGHVLYSTCSLEPCENQEQVRRLCAEHALSIVREHSLLPEGSGRTYRDGAYAALLAPA